MLWRQHKYSVLAREPAMYKAIGRRVAVPPVDQAVLAGELTAVLRVAPATGGMRNALQHMWGYVAHVEPPEPATLAGWSLWQLLLGVRDRAMRADCAYLLDSTALGELGAWLPGEA